jgi:hypothetical protein
MSLQELTKVTEQGILSIDTAQKYLNVYIGDSDWSKHINQLWLNLEAKNKNLDLSKEDIKRIIACTMLLPTYEKTTIPDPVHLILFWCTTWGQLKEKDWFSLLQDVVKKDILIQNNRKNLLDIGVIDPIDYSPLTRQASNWLYAEAENSGAINDSNRKEITTKLQNLVRIYGGAVISNIFTNHKNSLNKILNWRSGYFFEREIYNVYSYDQILKIKQLELQKLNPKYIKLISSK